MGVVARLSVQLTPRAPRDQLIAIEVDGAGLSVVRARVAAPPVDGRANAALERLLADALDLPPSRVRVVAGLTSRRKQVEVAGLSAEDALRRLEAGLTR